MGNTDRFARDYPGSNIGTAAKKLIEESMRLQWTKNDVIEDIQRVASALSRDSLSYREYQSQGKIGRERIKTLYGSWNKALQAASLKIRKAYRYSDQELLDEVASVVKKVGKIPSGEEWDQTGRIRRSVIKARFAGVAMACKKASVICPGLPVIEPKRVVQIALRCSGEKIGQPLSYPPFQNAPISELGTLGLFCCLAQQLGFEIVLIKHRFPDILAMRREKEGKALVKIEVEFRSRSYVYHGHPLVEPVILVCWEDNWNNSPANIEKIELSKILAQKKF
jgi:hypothetical protein